eukprot:390418-Lingulodinium_polyedra.AAC.1
MRCERAGVSPVGALRLFLAPPCMLQRIPEVRVSALPLSPKAGSDSQGAPRLFLGAPPLLPDGVQLLAVPSLEGPLFPAVGSRGRADLLLGAP